jgi:hypothetical protein
MVGENQNQTHWLEVHWINQKRPSTKIYWHKTTNKHTGRNHGQKTASCLETTLHRNLRTDGQHTGTKKNMQHLETRRPHAENKPNSRKKSQTPKYQKYLTTQTPRMYQTPKTKHSLRVYALKANSYYMTFWFTE